MNRASPVDLRKALHVANTYTKFGILFVAMPVLDAADHAQLVAQADHRLTTLEQRCCEGEAHGPV